MPFYEYQCSACHHHLEVMQKVAAPRLKKCPNCGKSTLSRLISAPVFRLAGSGWYETDFKSDKENKRNLAGASDAEPAAAANKDAPTKDKTAATDKPADKTGTAEAGGKEKSKDSGKESGKESGKDTKRESPSSAARDSKPAATRRTVSRKPAPRAPARKAAAKGKRR